MGKHLYGKKAPRKSRWGKRLKGKRLRLLDRR